MKRNSFVSAGSPPNCFNKQRCLFTNLCTNLFFCIPDRSDQNFAVAGGISCILWGSFHKESAVHLTGVNMWVCGADS